MPLYEYLCAKCGEKFEVLQRFSDAQLTELLRLAKTGLAPLRDAQDAALEAHLSGIDLR